MFLDLILTKLTQDPSQTCSEIQHRLTYADIDVISKGFDVRQMMGEINGVSGRRSRLAEDGWWRDRDRKRLILSLGSFGSFENIVGERSVIDDRIDLARCDAEIIIVRFCDLLEGREPLEQGRCGWIMIKIILTMVDQFAGQRVGLGVCGTLEVAAESTGLCADNSLERICEVGLTIKLEVAETRCANGPLEICARTVVVAGECLKARARESWAFGLLLIWPMGIRSR